jgi:hypothetical protein
MVYSVRLKINHRSQLFYLGSGEGLSRRTLLSLGEPDLSKGLKPFFVRQPLETLTIAIGDVCVKPEVPLGTDDAAAEKESGWYLISLKNRFQ